MVSSGMTKASSDHNFGKEFWKTVYDCQLGSTIDLDSEQAN